MDRKLGNYDFQQVDKLTGAVRQLVEAIDMHFGERDRLAIHSVAAAAHQVFADLANKHNAPHLLRNSNSYTSVEGYKKARRELCKSENFLKHADIDPKAELTFAPLLLEVFIMESIQVHAHLTGRNMWDFHIFALWFHQSFPGYSGSGKYAEGLRTIRDALPRPSDAGSWLALLRSKSGQAFAIDE